jgi:hypothetical protein
MTTPLMFELFERLRSPGRVKCDQANGGLRS